MSALNEHAITMLATVTGIDATAVAVTTLYTVPVGKTLVPDQVVIYVSAFTDGGKGTEATASFGGNGATYDDYINSVEYTVAAAGNTIKATIADSAFAVQAAGDVFSISIEIASDATVETWTAILMGHLM